MATTGEAGQLLCWCWGCQGTNTACRLKHQGQRVLVCGAHAPQAQGPHLLMHVQITESGVLKLIFHATLCLVVNTTTLGPLEGGAQQECVLWLGLCCRYFASRFPLLLLGVFFFALKHLDGDANLAKYWPSGQHQFAAFLKPWESMAVPASARAKGAKGPAGRRSSGSGLNSSRFSPSPVGGPSIPPRPPSAAGSSAGGQTAAAATAALLAAADASRPGVVSFRVVAAAAAARESGPANGSSGGNSREGLSNGGLATAAAAAAGSGGGAADGSPPVVGYTIAEEEEVLHMPSFPLRPGKQHCDFYVKTGHCKYGVDCVFDHPPEYVVPLTEQGLPFRPGQPVCTFYQKTQQCKYGPSCKFHHPKLVPIYAGSARQQ